MIAFLLGMALMWPLGFGWACWAWVKGYRKGVERTTAAVMF